MVVCFLDDTGHLLLVKFSSLDITNKGICRLYFHTCCTLIVLKNLLRHRVSDINQFILLS